MVVDWIWCKDVLGWKPSSLEQPSADFFLPLTREVVSGARVLRKLLSCKLRQIIWGRASQLPLHFHLVKSLPVRCSSLSPSPKPKVKTEDRNHHELNRLTTSPNPRNGVSISLLPWTASLAKLIQAHQLRGCRVRTCCSNHISISFMYSLHHP